MKVEVEEAKIPGGFSRSLPVDLRSRHLKGVILPDDWNAAVVTFRSGSEEDVAALKVVNAAGTEKSLTGSENELVLVAPADLGGLAFTVFNSGAFASPVNQGTPAGFAVIPNETDFSAGDPVTFTVTILDNEDVAYNVVLDDDYVDVDGLVAELQLQAEDIDWSNNAGAVTAEYSGNLGAAVDVTNIVDPDDKMNFSSIIAFAFPGYAEDVTLLLLTEPRI
jgi:hypothetical protein